MSLINQMLKDLEKRSPSKTPTATGLPAGVVTAAGRPKRRGTLRVGLVLVLLAAVGLAWFGGLAGPRPAAEKPPEIAATSASAVSAAPPVVSDQPRLAWTAAAPVEPARGPARLERLQIEQRDGRLQVTLAFSTLPTCRLIRGDQGRQLELELPEGMIVAALPDTSALPLLRSVTSEKRDEGARLVLAFHQACRYDELGWSEDSTGGGPTLHFVVQPESTDPSPAAEAVGDAGSLAAAGSRLQQPAAVDLPEEGAMVRREVPPTAREQAEQRCQQGITLLRQGRQQEAEQALRTALSVDPGHLGARDLLLRVLGRQNRQAESRALLAEGVREVPQHLPYRLRYARLLVEEGALERAREQLTREPRPAVGEALDLYALLATVYQRRGEYQEAAQTYRALLAVRPEQAVWWMGLGIALEGTGGQNQAEQAYRQALLRGGLSDGLQTYIRQRLSALGTREGQAPPAATNAG